MILLVSCSFAFKYLLCFVQGQSQLTKEIANKNICQLNKLKLLRKSLKFPVFQNACFDFGAGEPRLLRFEGGYFARK